MDGFTLPTPAEIAATQQNRENTPLRSDDYILKLASARLEKQRGYMTENLELRYKLIFLPYKMKAEDGIVDINNGEAKPLTRWLYKDVNPFAMAFKAKSTTPTDMRAILSWIQDIDPNGNEPIKMPNIIVLDKDDNIVSEELANKYKQQHQDVRSGAITADEFTMYKEGYKFIPDLAPFVGKYIAAKLTVVTNEKKNTKINKIEGFGRVPSSFKPDAEVEKAAMDKFAEAMKKNAEKRAASPTLSVQPDASKNDITLDDLPF